MYVHDKSFVNFGIRCEVGWGSYFLPMDIRLLQHHLLKSYSILPPLNCFCNFIRNQLSIFLWVYFGFSLLFHWPICLSFCQLYTVFIIVAKLVLILSRGILPTVFFLIKILWAILTSVLFHINFRIYLPMSTKNLAAILIGISLNL